MTSPSLENLLSKLLEATKERKVQWVETANENDFRVAFGGGVIRVSCDERNTDAPYGVVLLNRSGKVIESVWPVEKFDSPLNFDLVADLYRTARSSALKVDELLKSMSKALDSGQMDRLPVDEDDDIPF